MSQSIPRRRFLALGASAAGALVLTACSDPGSGAAPAGSSAGGTASAWPEAGARLDGKTITVWAAQNSNKLPAEVVAAFQTATGATVNVVTVPDPYEQGIQTKVASGDKPDLAFWQPTGSQLVALNAAQNLQPLDGAPFLDRYTASLKDVTGIYNGVRYAALISAPAVMGIWYNKKVLAQYGVTKTPTSFAAMVEIARTIKKAGGVPFFEMGKDRWAAQWWVQVQLADAAKAGLWERVNKREEKFTDPTILGAIQGYQDLIDEGLFNTNLKSATFEDQGAALLAGKTAMVCQVNTYFSQLQATADTETLNSTIGFFPISPSGNVGTFIPDQSNALVAFKTGDAGREAAARQLLNFWLSQNYGDFVTKENIVSIQGEVKTPTTVPTALVANADSIANSVGSMQVQAIVNPDLYLEIAKMITGQSTPQQVAQATQTQFDQLAQAIGAPGF